MANQLLRTGEASSHLSDCRLCEHRCHANRLGGEVGPCRAGPVARVYRNRIEYGEESAIVPSNAIYLSGCDLRCAFCIAGLDAFDTSRGDTLTPALLAAIITRGQDNNARTLQFVGGEPTIHLPAVLDAIAHCPVPLPPTVWKSDFCFTPEALELLEGVADIYIADFKFGNDHCAARIAGVRSYSYLSIITRNLCLAARQGRLIVRHLLMPGHLDCCFRPVLAWLLENLPDTEFSLRDGFLPAHRATSPRFIELNRPPSRSELSLARSLARESGLPLIY